MKTLTNCRVLPCNIKCARTFGFAPISMIIFGIKFWAWGSQLTNEVWRCVKCGYNGQFVQKKGMKFITLYWIIPTIPVSGISEIAQCPQCKTRYEAQKSGAPGTGNAPPPLAEP